jgi:hypothetical protein
VDIKRILTDVFGHTDLLHVIDDVLRKSSSSYLSSSNLAFLGRRDGAILKTLLSSSISDLTTDDLIKLLESHISRAAIGESAIEQWLSHNLEKLNSTELMKFTTALVENEMHADDSLVALIAMKANESPLPSSVDESAKLIASILHLSNYNYGIVSGKLFDYMTGKPVLDLHTIKLCQLIAAHMRIGNACVVTDPIFRFIRWIDGHLISKNRDVGIPSSADDFVQWYVPDGAVSDLSVYPVIIPLALPNPNINLGSLHQAKDANSVQLRLKNVGDCGIAFFKKENRADIVHNLRDSYLERIGWTVRYIANVADTTKQNAISCETAFTHICRGA